MDKAITTQKSDYANAKKQLLKDASAAKKEFDKGKETELVDEDQTFSNWVSNGNSAKLAQSYRDYTAAVAALEALLQEAGGHENEIENLQGEAKRWDTTLGVGRYGGVEPYDI